MTERNYQEFFFFDPLYKKIKGEINPSVFHTGAVATSSKCSLNGCIFYTEFNPKFGIIII